MRKRFGEALLMGCTYLGAALCAGVMISLVGYVLIKGIPHLKPSLFSLTYTSDNVSLLPAMITTLLMALCSLLIALPLGIGAAIYLVEYARRGNKAVVWIRMTTETLAGIPSIIYGLFGMLFFVTALGWGFSLIAGACTLAVMILPLILRSTEEALKAVPDLYREGAFGLGAGRLRTVMKVVLPAAMPGILAGVILSIGRIVGETAALIYTAGTMAQIPTNLTASARTLSVHMYALSSEGFHTNEASATAAVLLILVLGINTLSAYIARKLSRR